MVIDGNQMDMMPKDPGTDAGGLPPSAGGHPEPSERTARSLPEGPQKDLREMKKPKTVVLAPVPTREPIKIVLAPESPVVIKLDQVSAPEEPVAEVVSRRKSMSISPADEERRRLFLASKFSGFPGVLQLPESGHILYCCPACHERVEGGETDLGKVLVCSICGSEYKLPDQAGEGQIVLLRVDARRAQSEDLPPLSLPDERAEDGPSNEAFFQSFEELVPEGEEGVLEWGLEKEETKFEPARRMRWWTLVALGLFVFAAGFLVVNVWRASARTDATLAMVEAANLAHMTGDGGIDWAKVSSAQLFLLADKRIRAFLSAPDVAARAAVSRGGDGSLPRMQAHYDAMGGYEPETRAHGDVRDIEIREERVLGDQTFIMVRVKFVRGATGMYALLKGRGGLEVDWDYAAGYGEMRFEKLLEERPTHPVLLRGYLKESRYFNAGYVVTGYRNFDLSDATRGRSVPVYVARGSAAENVLREAWGDAVVGSIERGPAKEQELDFVLKVRYENTGGKNGFVIDEVLTRGWILPRLPP